MSYRLGAVSMSPDFTQDYLPLTEVVDWMTTLDSKTAFKRKNILEQIRRAIKKKEEGCVEEGFHSNSQKYLTVCPE